MSVGSVLVAMLIFWFLFIVGGLFVLFMWAIWAHYTSRPFKIGIVKPTFASCISVLTGLHNL